MSTETRVAVVDPDVIDKPVVGDAPDDEEKKEEIDVNTPVVDDEEKKEEIDVNTPVVDDEEKKEVIDVNAPVVEEEKIEAPGAKRSIRIFKEGDEQAPGEKIYTVTGDDVKDSDGNDLTDESLKKEILTKVNSTEGGSRRSRRNGRNGRNGHRQSKKRHQKRQSKKQKQNGGKRKHQSKRNHKK